MANKRLSKDKRALILAALCEGTPINAVTRMTGAAKESILRVIEECGTAMAEYMNQEFRDLPCERIELDEQWQYVAEHDQRMDKEKKKANPTHGDYWLWCAVDPDTKLVFSHLIARRDWNASKIFIEDISKRVVGGCQIATDNHRSYAGHISTYFGSSKKNAATGQKPGFSASRTTGIPRNGNCVARTAFQRLLPPRGKPSRLARLRGRLKSN